MPELLFLAQRLPFPPNKGDKIRSWHLLSHLAATFTVHLGCFIDDPDDWRHAPSLERICASTCFIPFGRRKAQLRSVAGLIQGMPMTFPYFRDARLSAWVRRLHSLRSIDVQFIFSSGMTPYAWTGNEFAGSTIIDLVDVDSDKWAQYAARRHWPLSLIYGREARLLAEAERRIVADADACLCISGDEARLLCAGDPRSKARVHVLGNGVDTEFFSPALDLPNPYPPAAGPIIVFTGVLDYWANVDAVVWFARQVMPAITQACPTARLYIIGRHPSASVRGLGALPDVVVSGAVADVRPYLAHATMAVAPLRIARGIQNKVLEAMAMGKPVLVSPPAKAGLDEVTGAELLVGEGAQEMAAAALRLILDERERWRLAIAARRCVVARYSWQQRFAELDAVLEGCQARAETHRMDRRSPGARAGGGLSARQEAGTGARTK